MGKVTKASVEADSMRVFRERFRKLVTDKGGDTAFATYAGVTRQSVGHWKNGPRVPDASSLIKIAKKCEVSVDWLLGLVDESNKSDKQIVKEVSSFTGLSSDAVDKLHIWQKPNRQFDDRTRSWTKMLSHLIVNEGQSQIINDLWVYLRLHESRGRYELYDTTKFLSDPDLDNCRLGRYGDDEVFLQFGEAQVDLNMKLIDSVQLDLLMDAIKEYRKSIWKPAEDAKE